MRRRIQKLEAAFESAMPKRHDPNERLPRDFVSKLHRVYGHPGTIPSEADFAATWGDVDAAIARTYGKPSQVSQAG